MKRIVALTVSASLITGCATMGEEYMPLVDRPGPNYAQDLEECRNYARNELSGGDAALFGAIAGGLFGLAVAAAFGSDMSSTHAKFGAISGAMGAGAGAQQNQRDVIRNCLMGRGHAVLR